MLFAYNAKGVAEPKYEYKYNRGENGIFVYIILEGLAPIYHVYCYEIVLTLLYKIRLNVSTSMNKVK